MIIMMTSPIITMFLKKMQFDTANKEDCDILDDVKELFLPKIDVFVEAIVSSEIKDTEIKDIFSRNDDTVKDVDIDFARSASIGVSINNYPVVSEGVPENSVELVISTKSSPNRKHSLMDSHPKFRKLFGCYS